MRFDSDSRHRSRGFTIASLFLLITVSGTLASLWLPLVEAIRQGKVGLEMILKIGAIMGSFGILLGIIPGLMQRKPLIGLFLGAGIGAVLGALLGPIMLVPSEFVGSVLRSSLFGSVTIVILAVALRRL